MTESAAINGRDLRESGEFDAAQPAEESGVEWEQLAAQRRSGPARSRPDLAVPARVVARPGRGQVTLDWEPVPGAIGYLVRRAATADGDFEPLVIGEPWVRPVPHPPLTDTTGEPGVAGWYTVAAVSAVDDHEQPTSAPLAATPLPGGDAACRVTVDAGAVVGALDRPWKAMIGAERLSQLDHGIGPGGTAIGTEFATALQMAHDELGVEAVRAHAILHDDLGVYREVDGEPVHDFTGIDRIYDQLLALGLRPIVEIGFMPHDLARDPTATVFHYRGIISPPHDWDRWVDLVTGVVRHLVERYGLDEVRNWAFEIWNEPNLDVFWSGTADEYFHLYDISAAAVKSVDDALAVGGPATAAVGWIDDFLEHANQSGAPVDFLSTHAYGNAPLDLRPAAERHGRAGLALWWTEWGAHATHFNSVHDSVWSAAYLARGMVSAMGRIDAVAYWTVSDHFEELGHPTTLLHGGFGLLGFGNLRKPRWWALWMLEQLRSQRLEVSVDGDAAGDMVNAIGSCDEDGTVALVVWNGTVDVSRAAGSQLLGRHVALTIIGLPAASYEVRHRRLDETHSNITGTWTRLAQGRDWPDDADWDTLHDADELADLEPPTSMTTTASSLEIGFDLPMPGLSLIELRPDD